VKRAMAIEGEKKRRAPPLFAGRPPRAEDAAAAADAGPPLLALLLPASVSLSFRPPPKPLALDPTHKHTRNTARDLL
jgi:hypothetical protein